MSHMIRENSFSISPFVWCTFVYVSQWPVNTRECLSKEISYLLIAIQYSQRLSIYFKANIHHMLSVLLLTVATVLQLASRLDQPPACLSTCYRPPDQSQQTSLACRLLNSILFQSFSHLGHTGVCPWLWCRKRPFQLAMTNKQTQHITSMTIYLCVRETFNKTIFN